MDDPLTDDEPEECAGICDRGSGCATCEAYWADMIRKGLWDPDRCRWTDKAWALLDMYV